MAYSLLSNSGNQLAADSLGYLLEVEEEYYGLSIDDNRDTLADGSDLLAVETFGPDKGLKVDYNDFLLSSFNDYLLFEEPDSVSSILVDEVDNYFAVSNRDYLAYSYVENVFALDAVGLTNSINRNTRVITRGLGGLNFTSNLNKTIRNFELKTSSLNYSASLGQTKRHFTTPGSALNFSYQVSGVTKTRIVINSPFNLSYSISDINGPTSKVADLNPVYLTGSLAAQTWVKSNVFSLGKLNSSLELLPITVSYAARVFDAPTVEYSYNIAPGTFDWLSKIREGYYTKDSANNYTLYVDENMDYFIDIELSPFKIDQTQVDFTGEFARHQASMVKYPLSITKDFLNNRIRLSVARDVSFGLRGAYVFDIYTSWPNGVILKLLGGKLIIQDTISR